MSWTYDPTLATAAHRVRFIVGDTDEFEPLFTDEEILAVLGQVGNDEAMASVRIAQALAARFARRADVAVGSLRENLSQLAQHYWTLTDRLEMQMRELSMGVNISVHGVSQAQMDAIEELQDHVPEAFATAAFDNPKSSVDDEGRDDRL